MAAHLLVIDAEPASHTLLRLSLQRAGYTVQVAGTGQAALDLYRASPSDLVLVEALLPDMDGFVVCAELRKRSRVPIVMLTALTRTDDILHGFSLGVDDYIAKPYRMAEVAVRLRAVLRRSTGHPPPRPACHILAAPDLLLNDTCHEVWARGALVPVTLLEYQVLRHLMSHPNCPISKSELCQTVWGYQVIPDSNFVEVAIRRLREKIEVNPSHPRFLLTVHSVGYLFMLPPLAAQAG